MKVYLAAARERLADVRDLAAILREAGHTLASTWHDEADADLMRSDAALETPDAESIAATCLREIDAADAFVLLADAQHGRGCWVELGYALSVTRAHATFVLGPQASAFAALALHMASVPALLDALEWLA